MVFQRTKNHKIDICNEHIMSKILKFSLPLMCSSIFQLLYSFIDIVVVSRYVGDNALAAVGSNIPLINLLLNLFISLSVGSNILAFWCYSAKQEEHLHQTVHTSITLSLISGALLALSGFLAVESILTWMQVPPEVYPLATVYLRIYFLGIPATMLYNFGSALLRATGDPRRPLYYLFLSGGINVALNLCFVVYLHMNVAGVAIATVISQSISAALVVRRMMRKSGAARLDVWQLRIYTDRLKQILQLGLPAGIQGMLFALSNVLIQASINSFGNVTMAGNAASANIEPFVNAAMNAFCQAAIFLTNENYATGQYERLRPIMTRTMGCVVTVGTVLGSLAVLLAPQLLGIYSDNPEVIAVGMMRMRIICATYVLGGMRDLLINVLRGMGYSVTPTVISLIGICGLRVLCLLTIFKIPALHTISTLYYAYPVSWIVTLAALVICYVRACKRLDEHLSTGDPLYNR